MSSSHDSTLVQVQKGGEKGQPSKEAWYRQMLKEAFELKITHPEVTKLREHIEAIDEWKSRVLMFLEDGQVYQKRNKEVFTQLIKETALFKVELDMTEDLQKRLEFIEWHAKVVILEGQLSKPLPDVEFMKGIEESKERSLEASSESSSFGENQVKKEVEEETVSIAKLLSLMEEGRPKGFDLVGLPEIQRLNEVSRQAIEF